MALRRKKIKSSDGIFLQEPRKCSFCKERKAFHSVHGGYVHGSGKTCCDDCYPELLQKEKELINQERKELSLGEEQAYRNFGL